MTLQRILEQWTRPVRQRKNGRMIHKPSGRLIDRDYIIYPLHGITIKKYDTHYMVLGTPIYVDHYWYYAVDHEYKCRKQGIPSLYRRMWFKSKGASVFNKKAVTPSRNIKHTAPHQEDKPVTTRKTQDGKKIYYPDKRMWVIFTDESRIESFNNRMAS